MQSVKHTTKPILVTGASGYIAGYIIKDLLAAGYQVRGTVRSLSNHKKYQHLNNLPQAKQLLDLVEGDLTDEKCWDKLTEGCDFVFHVASPVPPYVPKNQDEIIVPAVNGTKFVTQAAIRNRVKRLLYTSSGLTLLFGNDEKKILNEDDWADPTKCSHYPKAKILAEKALWELYNGQDHKSAHTEMVSVLPTLALGPGLTAHGNSSETMVLDILTGAFPGYPDVDLFLTAVDVRDVAKGHIKAMFTPALAGQRIALAGTHINLSEIIKILKKQFPTAPINDKALTVDQMKQSGNHSAERMLMTVGKKYCVDNSKSKKLLHMEYMPMEKTLTDMGNQLIKLGLVKI